MNSLIQLKRTTSVFLISVALFGFLPKMLAVSPAPDGCYPAFTTAEGCNALAGLTSGQGNTGIGWYSLFSAGSSNVNTGVGAGALALNTGDSNTAVGAAALLVNNTGSQNTAVGFSAMQNATGSGNVFNTAVGIQALMNTIANANTAVGDFALQNVSSGAGNTAIGAVAGGDQTTGGGNIYIGNGVRGVAGENNQTYIKNINTTSVSGGSTDFVTVDLTTGLLGHLSSSRRYKEEIKSMDNASDVLYQLKPVSYRYKKEIDRNQSPAFGLIAEDVAEVNPNLVARNAQGQIESVHYEMVNAMLLNEFLKARRQIDAQQKQIEALTMGLQKVTAELDLNKSGPQTVLNSQ